MGECKWENNTANEFRIVYLHWKVCTSSISCDGNVRQLSQTACMHACTHCLPFIRRRVLRLIMDPSKYQSAYTAWILGLLRIHVYIMYSWPRGWVWVTSWKVSTATLLAQCRPLMSHSIFLVKHSWGIKINIH